MFRFSVSVSVPYRQWRGRGEIPLVSKLIVVKLSEKKTADCSRRVLAIGSLDFDPRSLFDPVMRRQMSILREMGKFSTLPVRV